MKRAFIYIGLSGLAALTAFSLVGCSGAPSEGDISTTIKNQHERETADMRKMTGSYFTMPVTELKDVKKVGCKEDGEKAWRCDVEMKIKQGTVEKISVTAMRFVKSSDGWVVSAAR